MILTTNGLDITTSAAARHLPTPYPRTGTTGTAAAIFLSPLGIFDINDFPRRRVAEGAIARSHLFTWHGKLAIVLAIASLSLCLANRRFDWPVGYAISAHAYGTTGVNQRLADDGYHWLLPAATPVARPFFAAPVVPPQPAAVVLQQPGKSLYERPPPAA